MMERGGHMGTIAKLFADNGSQHRQPAEVD